MTYAVFDFADIHARLMNGFREPVKVEVVAPPAAPAPVTPPQPMARTKARAGFGDSLANIYAGRGQQAFNNAVANQSWRDF